MNYPDPSKHKIVSFIKSAVRVAACICGIITGHIQGFAIGLLLAEVIGIYEEMV